MKVNFNNMRKKAIQAYNDLVKKLNGSLVEDTDYIRVIVPVQDIQRTLDNLRDALVTIGCTYEENDPDFQCVINDNDEILEFNPV